MGLTEVSWSFTIQTGSDAHNPHLPRNTSQDVLVWRISDLNPAWTGSAFLPLYASGLSMAGLVLHLAINRPTAKNGQSGQQFPGSPASNSATHPGSQSWSRVDVMSTPSSHFVYNAARLGIMLGLLGVSIAAAATLRASGQQQFNIAQCVVYVGARCC